MSAAKSNPLQRLVRRCISPPFLVLRYEITGRAGMIQSGECSLLSGVDDRDAADREARDYLNRTAMINGECRYTITLQPWWLRIRIPPNAPHEGPGAASSRTVPLDAVVGRQRETEGEL